MKKAIYIIICLLTTTLLQAQVSETVNITTAGTLSTSTVNNLTDITNLTVTGTIDASDFQTMRDDMTKLAVLDLSGASVDGDFIPGSAFYNATSGLGKTSLTSVVLPTTTVIIGKNAFRACSGLKSITLQPLLSTIGDYAFYGSGLTTLTIPGAVASMGQYAFATCTALTTLTISAGVTVIGIYAFSGCTSIQTLTIPSSVSQLGNYSFQNCTALSTLTLNEGLKTIGKYAFNGCNVLATVIIPGTISQIDEFAFFGCIGLIQVIFNEGKVKGLAIIENGAFNGCKNITGTILFPSSIGEIRGSSWNYGAFFGCTSIKGIVLSEGITYIGSAAFSGCTSLTGNLVLPSTLKKIDDSSAFQTTGITSLTIQYGINYIGGSAFNNCTNLKGNLNIASSVNTIGYSSFQNCNMLTSLVIPSSITSIGNYAFDMQGLSTIKVYRTSPLSIDAYVFFQVDKSACILYVPYGTKAAYQSASVWKDFSNIIEMKGFTLVGTTANVSATNGSTGSVSITTNTTCTVSSDHSWLTITSPTISSGTSLIGFTATANPTMQTRTSTITITATGAEPQTITVTQAAGSATLSLSGSSATIAKDAGSKDSVIVNSNTTWSATASPGWLTLNKTTDSDTATLVFTASVNTTIAPRSATISVSATGITGSQIFTVNQKAGDTVLTISKTSATVAGIANNTATVDVTSNTTWTAKSLQNWVSISPNSNTSNNKTLTISVSANPSLVIRTTTITISAVGASDQTFTLTQEAGSATLTVSPSQSISATATSTNVAVSSNTTWTASSNQGWLTISPSTPTTNDGTLVLNTTENKTIVARTAIVTISATGVSPSKTINVTQAAGSATLSLSANTATIAKSAGSNNKITVFSNSSWTASSNLKWLTLDKTTGKDTSDLVFTAEGNSTISTREAIITLKATGVSDQILTVTQAIGDTILNVSTNTANVKSDLGSSVSFTVNSNTLWNIVSDLDWISLSPKTGTGYTTTVTATAGANTGAKRTATLTVSALGIASQKIIVTQDEFIPKIEVSTNALQFASKGGSANVTVTSNTTWEVSPIDSWLTINQTINQQIATIKLTASPNTGAVRTATVSIKATGVTTKNITITQADTITLVKQIADTSFALGSLANKYFFTNYFKYLGAGTIVYSVSSDNSSVVSPVNMGEKFGLVQYGTGSANITVTAKSTSGVTVSLHFKVTVSSTSTVDCTTLFVKGKTTDITCSGDKTGAIQLMVIGGMKPYNYKWSNTFSDTYISNLQAGTYSVIVTDSNLCSVQKTFTITEPAKVAMNAILTAPTCSLSNGKIALSVSGGTSPYTYKWNDGTTNSELSNKSAGQYVITITDNEACVQTETFDLSNTNAPIISLDSVVSSKCTQSNGKIALTVTGGTSPLSFNWNDNATTEDRDAISSGNYSLTVNDAAGCKATFKAVVPSKSFAQPTIALVTVSDSTGKNLVVWQKENTDAIKQYNIYREGDKAGFYEKIGDVQYADTSIYKDETANPQEQSWRYKISATDYCNNESPLSAEHKTIHLQKNQGMGKTINLAWDSYEGLEFYTYIIYRYSKSKGVEILKKVPASINSKSDLEPPSDVKSYSIGIELPDSIYPSKFKSDSGPFSVSLSNMAESELVGISTPVEEQVTISPNPANVNVTIAVASQQQFSFEIVDVLGRVVVAQSAIGSVKLDCTSFTKGVYFVKVLSGDSVTTNTLVVE